MKNNFAGKVISIMLLAVMLAGIFVPANFCTTVEAKNNEVESVIDRIIEWKSSSAQDLANDISKSMGSSISDWYAIALSRYKYDIDFSKCVDSLDRYTTSVKNLHATDMQRIAITYTAMEKKSEYINNALNSSIGKLGIMSYSYGLIMLDCGSYYGSMTRDEIINQILSMQFSDGGWGLKNSDVDITAMTVQALARYYNYSDVKNAVNKALDYLSKRQQADGDFMSYGTANAESTAQVLLALCTMKINYETDSRFIKNGNTVYNGLLKYRRSDGSFSHTYGGDSNQFATVQSFYALISLWRFENRKTAFFEFVSNDIQRETGQKSDTESSRPSGNSSSVNSKPSSSENTNSESIANNPTFSQETQSNQNTNQSSYVSSDVSERSDKELSTSIKQNTENSSESKFESSETTSLESPVTESRETIISEESTDIVKSNNEFSETEKSDISEANGVNYNLIIVLCLAGILGAIVIILIIRKKANKTNIIVLVVGFAVLTAISFTLKIEMPSQYYNETSDKEQDTISVVISISCKNALGKTNNDKIPESGIIIDDTDFSISEGKTVFDVLLTVAKQNKIQLDYDGSNGTIYIKGIGELYEFDCGELSGWIYKVNGETPNSGCSDYILKDGDIIEWCYTTNLGKDLK